MTEHNRRRMLKRSVGTIMGTSIIAGSAIADDSTDSGEANKRNRSNSARDDIHGTMEVTASGLSQAEFNAKRADETPGVQSMPDHSTENMIWVDGITGEIDLSKPTRDDGKVETGLRFFRANEKVGGSYIYTAIMDMQWKPDSGWLDNPWLKEQRIILEADGYDVIFRSADPMGELYHRERGYDLSLGVTLPSGAGASVGSTVYVRDGIQYNNRDLEAGGHYEMVFDGEDHQTYDPLTSIAVVNLQSDEKYTSSWDLNSNFDWDAEATSNMDVRR